MPSNPKNHKNHINFSLLCKHYCISIKKINNFTKQNTQKKIKIFKQEFSSF